MSGLLVDSLVRGLPEAELERLLLLLDGFVGLRLVGPDEVVLNLLVGPAEEPSQVLLEAKRFGAVALDEPGGVERFLLINVAIGVVKTVLALAEVEGVIGKEELDLAVCGLLDDGTSLLETSAHLQLQFCLHLLHALCQLTQVVSRSVEGIDGPGFEQGRAEHFLDQLLIVAFPCLNIIEQLEHPLPELQQFDLIVCLILAEMADERPHFLQI